MRVRRRRAGIVLGFDRVAVLPVVEALAGLLAELALGDLVFQPLRRLGHVAVDAAAQHLGDVQADVEPDLVGQFDRPHRHAEIFRRLVDGFLLHAGVEHHQRFEQIRRQRAVDQKARRAFHRRRQPVDAAEEGARVGEHLVGDLVVADHLDELHARHRIEEMDADQPLRPRQALAQLLERDARRVGGEDRVRLHLRLDAGKDLSLEVEHFRHRLDDQVGGGDAVALEIGDQAVERIAHLAAVVAADDGVELARRA